MLFKSELKTNWTLRAVIFLFSIIIHGIVLFLLIQALTPITIINFPLKVTPVTIVPREGLVLPSVSGQKGMEQVLTKGGTTGVGEGRTSLPEIREKAAYLDREAAILSTGLKPSGPMPSPPFNLKTRPHPGSSSFTLKLPAPTEKEPSPTSSERPRPGSPHDYWRYVLAIEPGKEKKEAGLGAPLIGSSGSPTAQVPRVAIEGPGYDLSPWAQEVVSRLQKNWQITASKAAIEKGTLHLKIGVDRSGEITFMRILLSSKKATFDRAALEAINLSLPLPRLPEGLPTDSLELTVIFECEESRK